MRNAKLSIVTINYNNAKDLFKTINSVLCQTWSDYEYIIIDGGSTDNSLEIIKNYSASFYYWVSEPDKGLFHAMNKGIEKATGDYLLMLNSGDCLCNEKVLEEIFSKNSYNEDLLIGDAYISLNDKIIGAKTFSHSMSFSFFLNTSLSHQTTFIKRSLHGNIGMYDEELLYSSDWKFFILAICKYNVSYKHLPLFISNCDAAGLTFNPMNFLSIKEERNRVLKQNFSAFMSDYDRLYYLEERLIKNIAKKILPFIKSHIKAVLFKTGLHSNNKIN